MKPKNNLSCRSALHLLKVKAYRFNSFGFKEIQNFTLLSKKYLPKGWKEIN